MSWVGWMLFVLMIVWHVASQNFSHRKRLHLRTYAVLLLLNDTIRDGHKKKLTDWIRESDARTALNLHERADDVIEKMADHLAVSGNSLLAALSSLWNSEAASELRSRAGAGTASGQRVPPEA